MLSLVSTLDVNYLIYIVFSNSLREKVKDIR